MNRPTEFFIEDETVYWYVSIVDVDGTPLDADSDPTLVYRRANGTGTTTTGVGVTKVSGTTGLYQFRHNTSLDSFLVPNTPIHYEEIAVINGTTYYNRWTSMIRSVATLANQTAIKAKTDQLTFTVANQVDANSLTGGTSPSAVADAVWDAQTSAHAIPGSTGEAVASAASEVSVILPATGTVPKRNQGETIQVYNQEEITVAVAVFDLAGNPVDLSTTGLWFGVWDRSKNMVTTATPTGTATGFTVVIPKLDRIGSGLTWVVRDSSATGQVILTGPFDILSRPYQ